MGTIRTPGWREGKECDARVWKQPEDTREDQSFAYLETCQGTCQGKKGWERSLKDVGSFLHMQDCGLKSVPTTFECTSFLPFFYLRKHCCVWGAGPIELDIVRCLLRMNKNYYYVLCPIL